MAKKDIPELLAPAGSLTALKAAVNAGADAVYISGKKFGARKFASNFTKEEMVECLKFAKLNNVKVYITVNTLMKDSQLKSAIEYIIWLYKNGADAIIVQDLGLAKLCMEIIPEMNLHASTQLTIHNSEGVKWAEKFGFKRIVLSRELKISEVKSVVNNISKNRPEIEIFGHGALCYSYSGQCLLSSFIGGRSGNRGVCAQPCRKAYKLIDGNMDKYGRPMNIRTSKFDDKFLLSTKDLCVYSYLPEVVDSQINSLKIEGRMRSEEYVAVVVNIYRKALDSLRTGKWSPKKEDMSKLKLVFNRGFSEGYLLKSDEKSVMGRDAPGNRGLYIGYVVGFNPKSKIATVKLKNQYKIEKGDGVVFRASKHSLKNREDLTEQNHSRNQIEVSPVGMAIEEDPFYNKNILKIKVHKPLNKNSELYLTRSLSLNHEAATIIKTVKNPSIPIELKVSLDEDMALKMEGKFQGLNDHEHSLMVISDFKLENAINKPLTHEKMMDQLNKTGKTKFKIAKIAIDVPETLFTPISNLNKVRREFFESAESELIKTCKPSEEEILAVNNRLKNHENRFFQNGSNIKSISNRSCVLGAYLDSIESLRGALEGGVKRAYFEPSLGDNLLNCNLNLEFSEDIKTKISSELQSAKELCREFDAELIWKWPQITHDSLIQSFMQILDSISDINEIMVDGQGAGVALESIDGVNLSCSVGFNVWNRESLTALSGRYKRITASPELSKKDLKSLVGGSRVQGIENPIEVIVQGNLDALISRDCLLKIVGENYSHNVQEFWGIEDETKHVFPVKIDLNGNTHVLNSVELCLLDHVQELVDMGVGGLVMDMRTKGYEYSKEMSSVYSSHLNHVLSGDSSNKLLKKFKSRIKNISTGGITAGNYLKGVKDVQL